MTVLLLICAPVSAQLGGLNGGAGGLGDVAPDVLSRPLPPTSDARDPLQREPRMSRAEAAQSARELYGGRVLAVRWTGSHYRVKLLRDGEIRFVTLKDGETVRSKGAGAQAEANAESDAPPQTE